MTTIKKALGAIDMVGAGRKEKNVQMRLETMQTQVALGQVQLDKAVEAGAKELKRLGDTLVSLRRLKLEPVSNFTALQAIYDKSLKTMTPEALAADYKIKADAFKKRIIGGGTHAQVEVVDAWYAIKAKKELLTIKSIEEVLGARKAQVTPAVVAQEAAPVLEPVAAE